MPHSPRPDCGCVACRAARRDFAPHRESCLCHKCRKMVGSIRLNIKIPKTVYDRYDSYANTIGVPRPDLMREALILWLKVADAKRLSIIQKGEENGGSK